MKIVNKAPSLVLNSILKYHRMRETPNETEINDEKAKAHKI